MNRTALRTSALAGSAAALLLLGGIGPAHAAAPSALETTCTEYTGDQALLLWGHELEPYWPPEAETRVEPQLLLADTSTYDPCAELSWITVPYGETADAHHAVMLFHHGSYLTTANRIPIPYEPDIERTESGKLVFTYPYLREGDYPRVPSGRAVSLYSWYEDGRTYRRDGELPPGV